MFTVFSNHKLSLGAKSSSCQLVKNLVGTLLSQTLVSHTRNRIHELTLFFGWL